MQRTLARALGVATIGAAVYLAYGAMPTAAAARPARPVEFLDSPAHQVLATRVGIRALARDIESRRAPYLMPNEFVAGFWEQGRPVYRWTGPGAPTYGVFTGIVWSCDDEECYAGLVEINGAKSWATGP